MQRNNYELFQVVFLDYLFGNADRIANCFLLDDYYLTLDIGFSDRSELNSVNYGKGFRLSTVATFFKKYNTGLD